MRRDGHYVGRYALRIALDCWTEEPEVSDHELKPPTDRWRAGERVDLRLKLRVPEDNPLELGQSMIVLVGFLDRAGDEVFPPVPGRYHLLVAYNCAWCQRVTLATSA